MDAINHALPLNGAPTLWRRITSYQLVRLLLVCSAIGLSFFLTRMVLRLEPLAALPKDVKYAILTCVMLAVYAIYVKVIEQRKLTELAWREGARHTLLGFACGALLFCLIVAVIALLGGYSITGWNSASVLASSLFSFFFVAVLEELVSRAIIFRIIEAALGSWLALLISALLFGAAHISNPNAGWFSSFAIAIEAGILLGAAFMLTRNLGFCVGIHWSWNFVQGGVFSIAVSGEKAQGWIQSTSQGPAWLTGGEFGAEASLVALLLATTAGVLILRIAIKRQQLIKPFWKRQQAD